MCVEVCPRECIYDHVVPVELDAKLCVDCGVCELECPIEAVSPPPVTS